MAMNQSYGNTTWGPQGTGQQYNGMNPQQAAAVKIPSTLTADEYAKLSQKQNTFSLAITDTQRMRGICNHRSLDGTRDVLVEDPVTGKLRCPICNYEFIPVDYAVTSPDEIKEVVLKMLDILQTIKMLYLNMPVDVAREYFMIIPLIEKVPELFEYACKDYAQHESYNPYSNNQNRGTNIVNLFNAIFGNGNGWQGQPQGPWAPDPNGVIANGGNPAINGFNGVDPITGAPVQNPQYGNPGYPNYGHSNGFVYTNPGYQTQTGGYAYVPGQQPEQPDVNSPAYKAGYEAAMKAQQGNTVNVSETVKAS